jgi:hypothetical protein
MKQLLIRAGAAAAAGALSTVGFTSVASASETDGWSWLSVEQDTTTPDGWSWLNVQPDTDTPDGWSWLNVQPDTDTPDGWSWLNIEPDTWAYIWSA